LAAKLGSQASAAEQAPCCFLSFGLATSHFADLLGWYAHRQSITALVTTTKRWTGSRTDPSPVPACRDTLSPRERAGNKDLTV
jgi:hypothetical protein